MGANVGPVCMIYKLYLTVMLFFEGPLESQYLAWCRNSLLLSW